MAEEKKTSIQFSRDSAGLGVNLSGAQINRNNRLVASQTPEVERSAHNLAESEHEFDSPSSQGQGESYRGSSSGQVPFPGMSIGADGVLLVPPEQLSDEDFDYRGTARK